MKKTKRNNTERSTCQKRLLKNCTNTNDAQGVSTYSVLQMANRLHKVNTLSGTLQAKLCQVLQDLQSTLTQNDLVVKNQVRTL